MKNPFNLLISAQNVLSFPHSKKVVKILFLLEAVLFIIVCLGFFDFKKKHETPFPVENLHYATQPKLTGWDDERFLRVTGETEREYAIRMNKVVGSSFYHCNYHNKENIFEIVASHFSKTWSDVGFLQPDRYCGFCHQVAYILARVLIAQGIDAYPIGMNGHVCVLVNDGNEKYIFDPDYVVGPMIYQDNMTNYIHELYGLNISTRPQLYKAFSTNTDDVKFYSMLWLDRAEEEQNSILAIVKGTYYLCVVGFIINTLVIIVMFCSRSR